MDITNQGLWFSGKLFESVNDNVKIYDVINENLLQQSHLLNSPMPKDAVRENCNSVTSLTPTSDGLHLITPTTGNQNNGVMFRFNNANMLLGVTYGDTVTFSVDLKGTTDSNNPKIQITTNYASTSGWWYSTGSSATFYTITDLSDKWKRYSVTKTLPQQSGTLFILGLSIHGNYESDIYIKNLKLEKGAISTPWCPNSTEYGETYSNSILGKAIIGTMIIGQDTISENSVLSANNFYEI